MLGEMVAAGARRRAQREVRNSSEQGRARGAPAACSTVITPSAEETKPIATIRQAGWAAGGKESGVRAPWAATVPDQDALAAWEEGVAV